MGRIIVQIYEVQTPSEAERLSELGVDHIGSVVLRKEEWRLSPLKETIDAIRSTAAKSSLIPLYNHPETVMETIAYYQPDIVHFCETLVGERDLWGYCDQLIRLQESVKQNFPEIKIMRSIPIMQPGRTGQIPTLEFARRFEPTSDYFLTDTFLNSPESSSKDSQPVRGFVGITGETCDWKIARKLVEASGIPVILAGGVSPQNVTRGILQVKPAGVDSCTRTNRVDEDGVVIRFKKDLDKVKQLVEHVRSLEKKAEF